MEILTWASSMWMVLSSFAGVYIRVSSMPDSSVQPVQKEQTLTEVNIKTGFKSKRYLTNKICWKVPRTFFGYNCIQTSCENARVWKSWGESRWAWWLCNLLLKKIYILWYFLIVSRCSATIGLVSGQLSKTAKCSSLAWVFLQRMICPVLVQVGIIWGQGNFLVFR